MRTKLFCAGFATMLLPACAFTLDERSVLPALKAPTSNLTPPAGYLVSEETFQLADIGAVHAVRLDNPSSNTTILFSGGNGWFTTAGSKRLQRIAQITGADIVTFDYPGRNGTTVPRSADALSAMGPALVARLKQEAWLGSGPNYSWGFSFGGSIAAALARNGSFDGLILESTTSDIKAVARNALPAVMKPFIRLKVGSELQRFDVAGYAASANAPILLLGATSDPMVDERTVRRFGERLEAAGASVQIVITPGNHGDAPDSKQGEAALKQFMRIR